MSKKLDRYEFIWKAIQKHGYKYDYRKVNYIDAKTKVCIICPEHGEFWQLLSMHIQGRGCPICVGKYITNNYFIIKAKKNMVISMIILKLSILIIILKYV